MESADREQHVNSFLGKKLIWSYRGHTVTTATRHLSNALISGSQVFMYVQRVQEALWSNTKIKLGSEKSLSPHDRKKKIPGKTYFPDTSSRILTVDLHRLSEQRRDTQSLRSLVTHWSVQGYPNIRKH